MSVSWRTTHENGAKCRVPQEALVANGGSVAPPLYHRHCATSAEFGFLAGPTSSDSARIARWLRHRTVGRPS